MKRITLKSLFWLVTVIAAYFAGRSPVGDLQNKLGKTQQSVRDRDRKLAELEETLIKWGCDFTVSDTQREKVRKVAAMAPTPEDIDHLRQFIKIMHLDDFSSVNEVMDEAEFTANTP